MHAISALAMTYVLRLDMDPHQSLPDPKMAETDSRIESVSITEPSTVGALFLTTYSTAGITSYIAYSHPHNGKVPT